MNRPMDLYGLRYSEFFQQFVMTRNAPTNDERRWFQLSSMGNEYGPPVFIRARKHCERVIVRLNMVMMGMGELYYLRLILMNKPISSYIDARTVNGMFL